MSTFAIGGWFSWMASAFNDVLKWCNASGYIVHLYPFPVNDPLAVPDFHNGFKGNLFSESRGVLLSDFLRMIFCVCTCGRLYFSNLPQTPLCSLVGDYRLPIGKHRVPCSDSLKNFPAMWPVALKLFEPYCTYKNTRKSFSVHLAKISVFEYPKAETWIPYHKY